MPRKNSDAGGFLFTLAQFLCELFSYHLTAALLRHNQKAFSRNFSTRKEFFYEEGILLARTSLSWARSCIFGCLIALQLHTITGKSGVLTVLFCPQPCEHTISPDPGVAQGMSFIAFSSTKEILHIIIWNMRNDWFWGRKSVNRQKPKSDRDPSCRTEKRQQRQRYLFCTAPFPAVLSCLQCSLSFSPRAFFFFLLSSISRRIWFPQSGKLFLVRQTSAIDFACCVASQAQRGARRRSDKHFGIQPSPARIAMLSRIAMVLFYIFSSALLLLF